MGQVTADIRIDRSEIVDIEADVERFGIAILDGQVEIICRHIRREIEGPANAQLIGFDGAVEMLCREVELSLLPRIHIGPQVDMVDGEMTARCFGLNLAILDIELTNEFFITLEARNLDESIIFLLVRRVFFLFLLSFLRILYIQQFHVLVKIEMEIAALFDGQLLQCRRTDTAHDHVPCANLEGACRDIGE